MRKYAWVVVAPTLLQLAWSWWNTVAAVGVTLVKGFIGS
jgi:hypothetical protein